MNLTKTTWPYGWRPDFDAVNGSPEGLLRADNLRLDKKGVLGLVDGSRSFFTGFPEFVENMSSRIVEQNEFFWFSTGAHGSSIRRYNLNLPVPVDLTNVSGAGTNTDTGRFGTALGQEIICAGNLRVKDTVVNPPQPLGLLTPAITGSPNGPTGFVNGQQWVDVPGPQTPITGTTDFPVSITVDPTSLNGELVSTNSFLMDTTIIGGVIADDPSSDTITLQFTAIQQLSTAVDTIEVDVLLDGTVTDPSTYQNYYQFVFHVGWYSTGGFNTQMTLSCKRSDFTRIGNNQALDWTKVIGLRYIVQGLQQVTCHLNDLFFFGGAQGGLNGVYNYVQISVTDNGTYQAKSPVSPMAVQAGTNNTDFPVYNGSVSLYPIENDPNATEFWFFRIAASDAGVDPNTGLSLNASSLGTWQFVGKCTRATAPFIDSQSDDFIQELNATGSFTQGLFFLQTMNTTDTSVNSNGSPNALTDTIYGIEGLYNGRMLYMGTSYVYLSDYLNPDAIDTRYTLRPSGDNSEINLWIKALTNSVIILATSKTIYEISGTLTPLPDGSIDVQIINIGEAYPPLSNDVCNYNGGLYYIAADGIRVTTGSNSTNVSPQLRHLFTGSPINTRHGVPGVAIYPAPTVNYSIAAAHGKIYAVLPMQDGTRRLFFVDVENQNFSQSSMQVQTVMGLMYTDPQKIYAGHSDLLFASYSVDGSNAVFIVDYAPGFGVQGPTGQPKGMPFTFRTVFDANQQPRNRKDTFTLKLIMDTGNAPVGVSIQKDGVGVTETDETAWISLGQYQTNGQGTIHIPLPSVTLGFRYAIQINDVNGVFTFKLYEMTIEYEPRPEQVDYMRIIPSNLETISRKRVTAYAFVIDTLGNNVQFTPYLDNIPWPEGPKVINNGTKLTYIYQFLSEAIATDIGGIINGNGNVFEFYGLNLEECVSEKMPTPRDFLVIPAENYGTPNRKRHTSYKFQINTRGAAVTFVPILDGVPYDSTNYTTSIKQTVEYFFTQAHGDVKGIDIGGTLAAQTATPFEFYGVVTPQKVEVLPDRLEYFRIPNSNFGVAARKRIRTIPIVIDTYGQPVTFTPIIDGTAGTPGTLVSSGKITTYYFFNTDVFGTDFGGILSTSTGQPFEFYELGQPEDVEILPVPKVYDQLGPMRLDKIGKFFGFRLRLIMNGTTTSLPYAIFDDNSPSVPSLSVPLWSGSVPVVPGIDQVREIIFPKNVNSCMVRLVLGPTTDSFHRYDVQMKVQQSGMESESQWQTIR